jgi:5-aminopentanamidase
MGMIKVGAYQAPLLPIGSIEAIELIADQVRTCEALGVQVLCCPEGIIGGLADYAEGPFEFAIDMRNRQLERLLMPLASETVTTIVGFSELGDDSRLFNSAAVVHKGTIVGVYRKRRPAINRSVYAAGDDTPIFTAGNLTFGIVICRDSTDTQLVRGIVECGASALFVPTNNGMPPARGGIDIVRQARETDMTLAKAAHVPVIRADVAGRSGGLVCHGASGVVDRHGTVLCAATPMEVELVVAEIEL